MLHEVNDRSSGSNHQGIDWSHIYFFKSHRNFMKSLHRAMFSHSVLEKKMIIIS